MWPQVLKPVLMRCRAFLPMGVDLSLAASSACLSSVVHIDAVRLGQIIMNGLR